MIIRAGQINPWNFKSVFYNMMRKYKLSYEFRMEELYYEQVLCS